MFYSHTFLSRKGPLGTVWIAAHLHHRLRKSHVAVTNIAASVDYIMFSDVPIALRLSGHLLLGVVRIYSKKVDYLYHDCNAVLTQIRSAFASVQVNLPEEASHAPFHSITLPETFELDAWDIDDAIHQAEAPDNHIKAQEEITVTDQIPAEGNPYVAFFINEDGRVDPYQTELPNDATKPMDEDFLPSVSRDSGAAGVIVPGPSNRAEESSQKFLEDHFPQDVPELDPYQSVVPNITDEPMDEDARPSHPSFPADSGSEGIEYPDPSNQVEESNWKFSEDQSPRDVPDIEILRDAVQSFRLENLPLWPDLGDNILEQQEPFDASENQKKKNLSPIEEGFSVSRGVDLPSQSNLLALTTRPVEEPEILDSRIPTGPILSELVIQPTPPVQKQKAKSRKRKVLLDCDTLVLRNKLMEEQLRDTSDLKRQRKRLPVTKLDVWKSYKSSQRERIFLEPSLSGMSIVLHEVLKKKFLALKADLIRRGALLEPMDVQSPARMLACEIETTHSPANAESLAIVPVCETENGLPPKDAHSPAGMHVYEAEIEHPRFDEVHFDGGLSELMPSPSGREEFTPFLASNLGSVSQAEKSPEIEPLQTPEIPSAELNNLDLETPITGLVERLSSGDTSQPDIPSILNSAEGEELSFLETDAMQIVSEENEVGMLAVRTRAMAQYLKSQFPMTPISECQSDHLSLNRILDGKTRKQCAKMFFEILVLTSCGLIKAQQAAAFGDITLSLTSMLSSDKL